MTGFLLLFLFHGVTEDSHGICRWELLVSDSGNSVFWDAMDLMERKLFVLSMEYRVKAKKKICVAIAHRRNDSRVR